MGGVSRGFRRGSTKERLTLAELRQQQKSGLANEKKRLSLELRDLLMAQLKAVQLGDGWTFELVFYGSRTKHPWRIDLCHEEAKIAVEIEGGAFARKGAKKCRYCGLIPQGGHNTGKGFEKNVEKYNEISLAGMILIRCTRNSITDGRAAAWITRAFALRESTFEISREQADKIVDQRYRTTEGARHWAW